VATLRNHFIVGAAISALVLACGATQHPREVLETAPPVAWEQAVRPVFARVCVSCHTKEGEAGLDLSTRGAWKRRSADIRRAVVVDQTMPPNGHPLSDDEREAIRGWIDGNP
jgi:mono/diheme cytochrome c family protein